MEPTPSDGQAPGTPLVPSTPPQPTVLDQSPASSAPAAAAAPAEATPQAAPVAADPAATPAPAAAVAPAAAAAPVEAAPKKQLTSVKDVGVSADRNARHRRFMEVPSRSYVYTILTGQDAHTIEDGIGGVPHRGFFGVFDGHGTHHVFCVGN